MKGDDWHLSKTVTIGLIFSVIGYGIIGVFYASWIFFQVNLLTERTDNNKIIIERLIKVETKVESITESVDRIEKSVGRIADKQGK